MKGVGGRADTGALTAALERLEHLVEQETRALSARGPADLAGFTARKNRALLELSRLAPLAQHAADDPALSASVRRVRTTLERNRSLLAIHHAAAEEVAAILAAAIQEQEWDGTYAPPVGTGAIRR